MVGALGGVALQGVTARAAGPFEMLATRWNWEPALLSALLYTAALYGLGVRRLWGRAGMGRGVSGWQVAAFAGALTALVIALLSPLDALAGALFSAHMLQHLLLVLVAAPLLVVSAPGYVMLWAFPIGVRRALAPAGLTLQRAWRAVSRPAVAWVLFVITIWLWHLPALYDAALGSEPLHALEHLCFLATAWLFWWQLLHPLGRRNLSRGASVLYVFTASIQGSALGALLTFAPSPLYPAYAVTQLSPLTPLQDQQLAGLLMWVPGGLLYLFLAAAFFAAWLNESGATPATAPSVEGGAP